MRNLTDFAIRHEYERIKELGNRLVEIGNGINWDDFRPKLNILFCNNTDRGIRPNIDVIVMLSCLFIQQLYNFSNEQFERELADRISFRMFLGTTEIVPDFTTIWKFRERLADSVVVKGIMQDASFITSYPGHAKSGTPHREEAKVNLGEEGNETLFRIQASWCHG